MTKKYLFNISKTYQKGDAREESYYKHLADFITAFSESQRNKKIDSVSRNQSRLCGIDVTILPKKTEAGNPDFRIWDGKQKIIGYIEAKDLGVDLDRIEDTEQLKRYLSTFPNVILTNYTEFRLYRNGEKIEQISIARPFVIKKLSTVPPLENEDKLFELLERFLDFSLPKTYTAKTLAIELAKRTKFLKDEIVSEELKIGTKSIQGFYEAFKEFLIAGISEEEFTDLYSQTITYGLFAARLRAEKDFNRKLAYSFIPKSIGILRDIFKFISLDELPPQMEIIIDDIADVLSAADAKKILDQYYHEGKGSDPVLHFYETFLSVYDPATREKRGVYYTPEPVVSFIVRSLHRILKDKFSINDGLAAKDVTLLDPAGGTLSFLAKAIEIAAEEIMNQVGGAVPMFIKERVLENYYAFELMMAPYAIGHMKMSFLLEELGYRMEDDERIKYYLTNTLEMKELDETKFPGMSSLSTESHEAGKIKKQVPILVVLGNPPYSGHSSNTGAWISNVIKDYYQVDGKPLGEKNPKWLQDDYVKFIRFAQWKIDETGEGVLGFITNHSYLDNPTFRGMRQSLMNSFDEIYILDLHGNSLKKEKAADGSKDENVFDIQQGVAIAFFIKYKKGKKKQIYHQEIFGLREAKYDWLDKHDIKNVKWKKIFPRPKFHLFIPTDNKLANHYYSFFKITEIFPVNSVGIVTARDNFVIDFERQVLERRIRDFINAKIDDEILKRSYSLTENQSWKIKEQREKLRKDLDWNDSITKILYRPFDERWILNHDDMIERSRKDVMQHMLEENIALVTSRQTNSDFRHVIVTQSITDFNVTGTAGSYGSGYIFPLYIYRKPKAAPKKKTASLTQLLMFEPEVEYEAIFSNVSLEVRKLLERNFKKPFLNPLDTDIECEGVGSKNIFYYIYAVLYSNIYRTKYAEFLKIDFPRIPFTKDYKLFIQLGKLGKQLADLHLLHSDDLRKVIPKFPFTERKKVDKIIYEDGKVWINNEQYFDGVKENVWKYQIGGYQVCEKWLKDRKERTLTFEEIQTYLKIVTALSKTIKLQKEIDKHFKRVEETV
ncbi:MAG: DNA methyltransferase [Ignavibacteria bacterium CG2_30_36_16]|nr:N-6 DNA methylase [Ignavibacteria bacterium]OIP60051.1 MAG: DNA methyltransferase [Ignavibacteria bacterium CG2_30_36_16]